MSATKFTRMPTSRQMLMMGIPELPEAAFGGDVPPQQRKALVQAMGIRPQGGGGGGGLMAVVGVAAAIAIPFAAPVIAASIGASLGVTAATFGMSAMAGSIVGSAIVGAGLGAITAKVTGQDVGRGALFGGIGGGIGGYTSAANAAQAAGGTAGTAGGATTAPSAVDLTGTAVAPTGGMTAGMTQAEMLAAQEAGFGMTQQAQMLAAQDAGLGATLSSGAGAESAYAYAAPTAGLDTATAGAATAGTGTAPAGGVSQQQAILNAQDAAVGATPSTSPTAVGYQANTAPTTMLGKFGEGVSKVGTEIGKKFTDPKQQADLVLRAAGQIAGTYLADDLPPEQRQLLDQQRAELEQLRTTNNALFQEKLSAAQQLVGNASYFDPEYFGLQRARKTQLAGAQLERDTLAKISPQRAGLRAAEQRRLRLGTSRDTGTAYDMGFTSGVDAQNKQLTAGLNLYPSAPTSALSQGTALMGAYGSAEDRRRKSIADTSKLFGSFTG